MGALSKCPFPLSLLTVLVALATTIMLFVLNLSKPLGGYGWGK